MAQIHILSRAEAGRTFRTMPAAVAGLIAGLVFIVLQMILVPLFLAESPWQPVQRIAAILIGREALPPAPALDVVVVFAALAVHFGLAVIYGLVLSYLVFRLEIGMALLVGAVFGLVLYLINLYGFAGLLFPWFAAARNWVYVVLHLVFGLTGAWAYKALAGRESRSAHHARSR